MDERHSDYVAYYEARMKKFEGSELYKESALTEKALYEAIASCEKLEDFKEKLEAGNLHVKNAIALIKDKEKGFRDLYLKIKEVIRAKAAEQILEKVDEIETVEDLTTFVTEIETKNSIAISVDEFTDEFYYDFDVLESIEVRKNAEVPDEWKKDIDEKVQDMIAKGREDWKESVVPNARNWDPNWSFNYDLIFEERHRRKIPFPDEIVKKRIDQHKEYRGT
jgi:hypothetical protein